MTSELQEYISRLNELVSPIDLDLAIVVVALAVIYCITVVMSLRAQKSASQEISVLKERIEILGREVETLRKAAVERERVEPSPVIPSPIVPSPEVGRISIAEEAKVAPLQPPSVSVSAQVPAPVSAPVPEVSSIVRGMAKSRSSFLAKIKGLFSGRRNVDLASLDDLEEVLITSDVGARVAESLVSAVRERASQSQEVTEEVLRGLLREGIGSVLLPVPTTHRMYQPVGSPMVVLVVGVNGVGKTTSVAKLATRYKGEGKKVLAIAADTFRAAAVQQLNEWGSRSGFEVFSGSEGAKPAAVVFDGMVAAKERGVDVVLVDTAGRLHTKSNLMQELEGVRNSIKRHVPDAPHETVLVVDGVSGQNALAQAREFNASTPLTGLIVTKLDGTPKGGIIVAISQELKIPVLYVGVGEKANDLLQFSVSEFIDGLLSHDLNGRGESPVRIGDSPAAHVGNSV